MQRESQNRYPHMETLQHAVSILTKDWTHEQRVEFSKQCFDTVAIQRFNKYRRYPNMTIQITKRG